MTETIYTIFSLLILLLPKIIESQNFTRVAKLAFPGEISSREEKHFTSDFSAVLSVY